MKFYLFLLGIVWQTIVRAEFYDCFTFFNELELLKVRLAELYDVVDHFVLVEASHTFSGNPKPLYFLENKQCFEKYNDKLIHVIVNDFPPATSDLANDRWVREEFQRNAINRGLTECCDEDIILISDLDEIPNRYAIQEIRNFYKTRPQRHLRTNRRHRFEEMSFQRENQFVCELHMRLFLFYLDQESPVGWTGAVKASFWLVKKRSCWDLKILHMQDGNLPKIYHAGWHFHSMGGQEQIVEKLKAIYAHDVTSFLHPAIFKEVSPLLVPLEKEVLQQQEWPDSAEIAKNPALYKSWTETIFGTQSVSIDATYPQYIQDHIDEYRLMGWIH